MSRLHRVAWAMVVAAGVVGAAGTAGAAPPAKQPTKRQPVRAVPVAEPATPVPPYLDRADVRDYIDELVRAHGFAHGDLVRLFADARYSAVAARLMMPSSTGVRRDWSVYRARFVEPVRIAAGQRFWEENEAVLARAEEEFGVPAEIVVGILGVETVYGRNTGNFRVVDALTTLAFDYPNKARDRSAFFKDQLTDLLLWTRKDGRDFGGLRGSYAGAIGMPQFMPGSILRYAIDYDGDGRVDLVGSVADVVGSVANFLVLHGWVRGLATHLPLKTAAVDPARAVRLQQMVDAGSVPSFNELDLQLAGLTAVAPFPAAAFALIDLPSGADVDGRPVVGYLAGTQNFHAVTRYNRSYFYAYSVIELGMTIKALRAARSVAAARP